MLKGFKLNRSEEGAGLLLCIIILAVMLAVGGLVVDMGIVYKTKGEMRKAANAAALSGAQVMFKSDDTITGVVDYVLEANNEKDALESVLIKPDGKYKITVALKRDVNLYFVKFFGISSIPVEVTSSAEAGPLGIADGAVPLGVPSSVIDSIGDGQEYDLKVGPGSSEYGNFGIISLSDSWSIGKDYESDLTYGYNGEISVGQVLETETGNVEGKTKNAIEYRINNSENTEVGLPSGDIDLQNDTRLLKVLVYEEVDTNGQQLKEIEVIGFAYFYLKKTDGKDYSTITGYFIKGLESGALDENAIEKGAYAIRLVE